MNYLKRLLISIKIYYYSFMESFEVKSSGIESRSVEQSRQNIKLIRGVRKLVDRLRSMSPEDRTKPETLLGTDPYKKTKQEVLEELRVRHKVINNPTLSTEDDLVNKVVKNAPRYSLQIKKREILKKLRIVIEKSAKDPSNPLYIVEARRLKLVSDNLEKEIKRLRNNG